MSFYRYMKGGRLIGCRERKVRSLMIRSLTAPATSSVLFATAMPPITVLLSVAKKVPTA